MTPEFILKKVEVFSGYREDAPDIPRWYVNHHYVDGSECVVHDTLSHDEAIAGAMHDALDDGVPVQDNSAS